MVDIFVRLMPSNLADHEEGRHRVSLCVRAAAAKHTSGVECGKERVRVN